MKISGLISLALVVAGGAASARPLSRRQRWDREHRRVAICVDFDDAFAAAIRAGMPFGDMLRELASHGATHVSLPELTLNRLQASGRLARQAPSAPRTGQPRVGHWNYLHGEPALVAYLVEELAARLPYAEAGVTGDSTLSFAGDLPTLGEIGLGFEAPLADRIQARGLGIVPRPVSYAWPEPRLIARTLSQAARLGRLIAFDGGLILGHEMQLDDTLAAMEREGLTLVYFAQSRHQKGDWFVAKRRAPRVVLAHRFTPQDMIPLDDHSASHVWVHLARERGIRLCYVNFFRVLHATQPLGGLHYVEHIREALEADGYQVVRDAGSPAPLPEPTRRELALIGLAPAGVAASAASAVASLPEAGALPLVAAAAIGAGALPFLERPRSHLEEQYPPSYAPKILALAASLAPLSLLPSRHDGAAGWMAGLAMQVGAAASLAALTSGRDYRLRIEEYRGFNLDWLLPLLGAAQSIPDRSLRVGALAALAGMWLLATRARLDPLARLDPAHAVGHTHHLSAAQRLAGDARIALGPQPGRKWAGLGPLGAALSLALASRGRAGWGAVAAFAGAAGGALGLAGFRRPERAIALTAAQAARSFGIGAAIGGLILGLARRASDA